MCAIFSSPCSSGASCSAGSASESDGGLSDEEGSSQREANGFVVSLSPVVSPVEVKKSSFSPLVQAPSRCEDTQSCHSQAVLANEESETPNIAPIHTESTNPLVSETRTTDHILNNQASSACSPVRRKEEQQVDSSNQESKLRTRQNDNDDISTSRIHINITKTSINNNNKPFEFPHAAGTASLSRPLAYDAALPPFPPSLFYAMYKGTPTTLSNKTLGSASPTAANGAAMPQNQRSNASDMTVSHSEQQNERPEDSLEGIPRPLCEDDLVPEGSGLYDLASIALPRLPPALDFAQQQPQPTTTATPMPIPAKRNTFTFNNTSNYTAQLHRYFYDAYNNNPNNGAGSSVTNAMQGGGYQYKPLDTIILPFGTSPNSVGNGPATFRSFNSASSARGGAGRAPGTLPGGQSPSHPHHLSHRPTHGHEHQRLVAANATNGSSASVASTPTAHHRRQVPPNFRAPSHSAASVVSSASSVSGYHPSLGYQPALHYATHTALHQQHHGGPRQGATAPSSNVVVAAVSSDGSVVTMTKRRAVVSQQPETPPSDSRQREVATPSTKDKQKGDYESVTTTHDIREEGTVSTKAMARGASATSFADERIGEDTASTKPPQKQYFVHNPYKTCSHYSGSNYNANNTIMHQPPDGIGGSQRAGSVASATTPTTTRGAHGFPSPSSALHYHLEGSPSYANSQNYYPYIPSSASAMATPPPAYGAQFYDALPWTESSARSSLHDDECDDGSMMLNEGLEDDPNNDYPPNPDYYGLPTIDTPVPQVPPILMSGGPPTYSDVNNTSNQNQGGTPPPPGYDDAVQSSLAGRGGGMSGGERSTPNAPGGVYPSNPTPPQYGLGGGSQHHSSPQPQYSSSSQHNAFAGSMPNHQQGSYNPAYTANTSSTFNPTPNHGKNVHIDALQNVATYVPYYDTAKGTDSTNPPPARRYRHDYHAQPIVLRVSSLPFERLGQAASDMQDVLDAVCGGLERERQQKEKEERERETHHSAASAHNNNNMSSTHGGGAAPKQAHHSRRITVRVEGAEKSLKSNSVYIFVSTAEEPDTIVAAFQKVTVLMDRKGFHIARTAEERAAVAAYCDRIRNLPQRARHWRMDGLPSTPISFKVM